MQETMDTIAHEAFHVQQAYVVENIDWDDAATQAAYYDQPMAVELSEWVCLGRGCSRRDLCSGRDCRG